jgi:PAS domain S-box-containing protein
MRLKRQFEALILVGVLLAAGSLGLLAWTVQQERQLAWAQESAVAMAREVTGLLVLTQDFLLFGEPRARDQWAVGYRRLAAAHASARDGAAGLHEVERLAPVEQLELLAELFGQLLQAPAADGDAELRARQRELAVDRLLATGQLLADNAYARERDITARRNETERRFIVLSLAGLGLLSALFALLGVLIARRVLRPLAALGDAMNAAVPVPWPEDPAPARDEIGELAQRFDRLTEQLARHSVTLKESEALLRLVVDHLPAMIGYWDREGRNLLANADYRRWFGKGPEEIRGRRIDELLGPVLYAKNRPFIEGALAGEQQEFDRTIPGPDGIVRHSHASYVPDVRGGRVEGFVVLVTDITDRVNSEQTLARALAERETLLKEVYHRVKNNLQVVQSLQCRTVTDESAREALNDTAQRVRAMALVHEHLYEAPKLSDVSLPRYVSALVQQIVSGHGDRHGCEIRMLTDVGDLAIGPDAAIPLGLLLTELVVNCLKHAFTGRSLGHVTVSVQPQDGGVRVAVSDDGRGLPPDTAERVPPSLGRQLAAGLARQLGGELQYDRVPGGGTVAWVQLPQL